MKNSRRIFILTEIALGIMLIVLSLLMIRERNGADKDKISVIIENSEDNQWSAFKYGLQMAAEDLGVEVFVVSTGERLMAKEETDLIQEELNYGAEGVIVQPVTGTEDGLKEMEKKIPIMLVEPVVGAQGQHTDLAAARTDDYAIGRNLAEELLKDYGGNIEGKSLLILSETGDSEAVINRQKGIGETLQGTGVKIQWSVYNSLQQSKEVFMGRLPKANFVIALDDGSLTMAGEYSAANNLHGAVVYGVARSMEAIYYLDTGSVECVAVPDDFNLGYQSVAGAVESLRTVPRRKAEDRQISHTIIRREELFLKENQEILYTMGQ